jgi:hypothetical protein
MKCVLLSVFSASHHDLYVVTCFGFSSAKPVFRPREAKKGNEICLIGLQSMRNEVMRPLWRLRASYEYRWNALHGSCGRIWTLSKFQFTKQVSLSERTSHNPRLPYLHVLLLLATLTRRSMSGHIRYPLISIHWSQLMSLCRTSILSRQVSAKEAVGRSSPLLSSDSTCYSGTTHTYTSFSMILSCLVCLSPVLHQDKKKKKKKKKAFYILEFCFADVWFYE